MDQREEDTAVSPSPQLNDSHTFVWQKYNALDTIPLNL